MPFNPNIPQPNDRLAKSQQDLLQNNQQLDTSFGINHYAFSDLTAFNGMHKQCQMVEQSVDPSPVGTTDSIYTKVVTHPSGPLGELFYIRGGSVTPIPMTCGTIFPYTNNYTPESGGGPVGVAYTAGATFLPGGLLYQYGTVVTGSNFTIKFPKVFLSAPQNIQLTANASQGSGARIALSTFSANTIQFNGQITISGTVTINFINWVAIGLG